MAETLHRITPDLEVRTSGEGRTVFGLLVPFNVDAEVDDGTGRYVERFVAGSFATTLAQRGDRVKLRAQHTRIPLPVGRFTLLREDTAGLYGEAKVSATPLGDEVLELVRDGALDSWSVGFRPVRDRRARDGATERLEVALRECSLTDSPCYESALVAGVRSVHDPSLDRERWRHRLALHKDY